MIRMSRLLNEHKRIIITSSIYFIISIVYSINLHNFNQQIKNESYITIVQNSNIISYILGATMLIIMGVINFLYIFKQLFKSYESMWSYLLILFLLIVHIIFFILIIYLIQNPILRAIFSTFCLGVTITSALSNK